MIENCGITPHTLREEDPHMASNKKREHEVIAMLSTGMSQREVARQLGCHYNTIGAVAKSDRVKRLLEQIGGGL